MKPPREFLRTDVAFANYVEGLHPENADRARDGADALDRIEEHYANGEHRANLTDLLCDILHTGRVTIGELVDAVRLAGEHHREESALSGADAAADAADARAEGMVP